MTPTVPRVKWIQGSSYSCLCALTDPLTLSLHVAVPCSHDRRSLRAAGGAPPGASAGAHDLGWGAREGPPCCQGIHAAVHARYCTALAQVRLRGSTLVLILTTFGQTLVSCWTWGAPVQRCMLQHRLRQESAG